MRDQRYRNYLLTVLTIIFMFNTVDRVALGLLIQGIKTDLELSDTELGFLTGIAFAFFYAVMGIPIARWADRGNRVVIIAITTFLWSVAVVLCGTAVNYWQLLLIRVGVAVGEAGCVPPAHSLIAEYFRREERPRAVARYMLGIPLSAIFGYFVAGWLNELYGWRVTFALLGLPGVVLAAVAWFTLREPRSESACDRARDGHESGCSASVSVLEACAIMFRNTTFRHLLMCFAVASFFGVGIAQWKAAFFMRSYGLQSGELGTWLALIYGVCGPLGMYWGGEWASRHAVNNESRQLKVMALAYCAFSVVSVFIYLAPNQYLAFVFLSLGTVGYYMTYGPFFATVQTLIPERMRAMSIAVMFLFANLIGMGLGPLAAGALSDALRSWAGEDSLRYALMMMCPGYLWAGWHLWRGSFTVRQDLITTRQEMERERAAQRLGGVSDNESSRSRVGASRLRT